MYDSTYGDSSIYSSGSASDAAIGSAVLGSMLLFFIFIFVFVAIVYVVGAILLGIIFKKAGIEAWKAWVPIYNTWVMLEMGGQKGWLALIGLIPGASIITAVFMYIAMYHIANRFGKDGMMLVLLSLFVPFLWHVWLAIDKTAVWDQTGHHTKPAHH